MGQDRHAHARAQSCHLDRVCVYWINNSSVIGRVQDESFVEISHPSMCTMCEQDDSLLKTKVQT